MFNVSNDFQSSILKLVIPIDSLGVPCAKLPAFIAMKRIFEQSFRRKLVWLVWSDSLHQTLDHWLWRYIPAYNIKEIFLRMYSSKTKIIHGCILVMRMRSTFSDPPPFPPMIPNLHTFSLDLLPLFAVSHKFCDGREERLSRNSRLGYPAHTQYGRPMTLSESECKH